MSPAPLQRLVWTLVATAVAVAIGVLALAQPAAAAPDLVVADWSAPAEASAQLTIAYNWTARNDGDAEATPSWTDTAYLSADDVCCAGDTVLTNLGRSTALAPGANYTAARTGVTVPSVAPGAYYLLIRLDSGNAKAEENEGNNVQAAPFTVRVADLVPQAFTAPDEGTTGEDIVVTWNVTNQGDGTAKSGYADYFYLSTDAVCCAGDTFISSTIRTATVPPGAAYASSRTLTLPNRPAGAYTLFLATDGSDVIWENGGQVNNFLGVPFTLRTPDLVPIALTAPAEGIAGEPIAIAFEVRNQGDGLAGAPWREGFWLSADGVCCAGDIPATPEYTRTADLAAGASYQHAMNLTLPAAANGTYHLLLKVDKDGVRYEANETNNVYDLASFRLRIADLQPVSFEVQPVASSGDDLWVNWTGRNAGDGTAVGFWWDSVSFSQQTTCCPQNGYQRMGKLQHAANLSAGAEYTRNATFNVHEAVATTPGTYRIYIQLDKEQDFPTMPNNVVEPGLEGNNWASTSFTVVIPDLQATGFTAPASAKKQTPINLSWTAQNVGEGRVVRDWFDRVTLGPTPPGYANAAVADETSTMTLESGDSYAEQDTLTLPNWPPGVYTLNLTLDRFNAVHEYGGSPAGIEPPNNWLTRRIALDMPDLAPTALRAPSAARGGGAVEVGWTVANIGAGRAVAPWEDRVYLSADAVLDAGDTLLGAVARAANLTDGASYDADQTFTLPAQDGPFFLLVQTDGGAAVNEGWEDNNVLALAVTLDSTAPDTTILAGPAALVNVTGAAFTFAATEAATFACALDGAAAGACASPWTLEGLADGAHTVEVTATDLVGNPDPTPAAWTWTVDTTPPDTTLSQAPPALTNLTGATLAFAATEAATFACALDGGPAEACASPRVLEGLADGDHTFTVRATDLAGNADPTPASHAWRVDTRPPETSILTGPPAYTSQQAATLTFAADEAGATFACSLDGAPMAACASPHDLAGLAHGAHTFDVAATDPAGNTDPTPARWTWTVDTTPPEVVLLRPEGAIYLLDEEVLEEPVLIVAVGPLTVRARATEDLSPITAVRFLVDRAPLDPAEVQYNATSQEWSFVLRDGLGLRNVTFEATNAALLTGEDGVGLLFVPLPEAPAVELALAPPRPAVAAPTRLSKD